MGERKWKLGEDMYPEDSVLDGFSFNDIIRAVRCGCRDMSDKSEIISIYKDIIQQRLEDADFVLMNNLDEIIRYASWEAEEE